MKLFDHVVVACDQTTLELANAVRAVLECFRLRVHLYELVQRRNAVDFFAGDIPAAEYVILCLGGHHGEAESGSGGIGCLVVDNADGGWEPVEFNLTPDKVPDVVHLVGRTVIALGCNAGEEALASAFLQAGCKAYIGAVRSVDEFATLVFVTSFFYFLIGPDAGESGRQGYPASEAVCRAASVDSEFPEGTQVFRYYGRAEGD